LRDKSGSENRRREVNLSVYREKERFAMKLEGRGGVQVGYIMGRVGNSSLEQ